MRLVIGAPVSLVNRKSIDEAKLSLRSCPSARSVEPVAPKLYVSPAFEEPVPAVYVTFALASDSVTLTPGGVVLDVPVLASASKFSVRTWVEVIDAVPSAVTGDGATATRTARVEATKVASAALAPNRVRNIHPKVPSPRPPICTVLVAP